MTAVCAFLQHTRTSIGDNDNCWVGEVRLAIIVRLVNIKTQGGQGKYNGDYCISLLSALSWALLL